MDFECGKGEMGEFIETNEVGERTQQHHLALARREAYEFPYEDLQFAVFPESSQVSTKADSSALI